MRGLLAHGVIGSFHGSKLVLEGMTSDGVMAGHAWSVYVNCSVPFQPITVFIYGLVHQPSIRLDGVGRKSAKHLVAVVDLAGRKLIAKFKCFVAALLLGFQEAHHLCFRGICADGRVVINQV